MSDLEQQIKSLDKENAAHPSTETYKKVLSLRYKYNQLLSDRITRSFIFTQQKYFEFGEKPHRLLARHLRKLENDRTISKVKSEHGVILTSQKDINHRFRKFYESLYSSKAGSDDLIIQTFFDSCNLPILSQEDRDFLNAHLSIMDIQQTISTLKCGKAAGPDGYPAEFYKEFRDLLTPYLLKMYTQANLDGTLPPTLNEAIITVILKKRKDPEEVTSYRPISLLSCDQKMLAKILASRLSSLIGKLIHPDQTGFIPNRHSFFNLRRFFNIM